LRGTQIVVWPPASPKAVRRPPFHLFGLYHDTG
jgi:hypothetical protein